MEANFLPELVELTEPTSIALAQSIRVKRRYSLSDSAIATTYVHQGSGGIPILLLRLR